MAPSTKPNGSSRRRSLMDSASKKFTFLDRSKSGKERLTDDEDTCKITISPPYDFRDLNSNSSSSGVSNADHTASSTTPRSRQIDPSSCLSPQDKPLPSLPVATIMTNSPLKTKRLLIDAEEKPLRRSVSPTQQNFEDWPSLSPEKQRKNIPNAKVPTPVKASVSEGLAERIKQLNLDDDVVKVQEVPHKHRPETGPTINSPAEVDSVRSTRSRPNSKAQVPQIRHTKASQLRLRFSVENLAKQKKASLPSPLADNWHNTSTRARPLKRPDATSRARTVEKSRSRSRHRVTAEGSPYVTTPKVPGSIHSDLSRRNSLILDASKIDTNFTDAVPQLSQAAADTITKSDIEERRKSSIPLPKRLRPPLHDLGNAVRTDPSQSCDGKALNSPSATMINSHVGDAPGDARDMMPELSSSASAENDEEFSIRPVSRDAPEHGPTLRISPRADEYLREIGSVFHSEEKSVSSTNGHVVGSSGQLHRSLSRSTAAHLTPCQIYNNAQTENEFSADQTPKLKQQAQPPVLPGVSQPHALSRKAVSGAHQDICNDRNVLHATPTSAPPIKSGTPKDDSRTSAWPFKESAVAPFKTSVTPERDVWNARGKESSNRSSNESGQTAPSSGHSVRSRYAVSEALRRVTPVERTTVKQPCKVTNATGDMQKAAVACDEVVVFPPRNTSRLDQSMPLTGLRKHSAPAYDPITNNPWTSRNTTVPRLTPSGQTHNVKSARSAHNLTQSTRVGSYSASKPLLTPKSASAAHSTSASKGVLSNIRTLFHKRSTLHVSMHNPLHRPHRNDPGSISSKKVVHSNFTMTPSPSTQPPRSPQVKNTSHFARMFPDNPNVHPLAISSYFEPDLESSPESTRSRTHLKQAAADTKPRTETPTKLGQQTVVGPHSAAFEPPYLATATNLVYTLLEYVQKEPNTPANKDRKELLLELSKVLVDVLSQARDVEKNLERMKAEVVRCEMKVVEVRKLVSVVEGLVRRVGIDE